MLRHSAPSFSSSSSNKNSISVITSFFLVRGLKGAFTFSFSPQKPQNQNDDQQEVKLPFSPSSSFLAKIGEETLKKLYQGNFTNNNGIGAFSNDEDTRIVNAAVGRQLEYLHCLLMNLHSPIVKNVLLLIQDDPSAEFLFELLSSSTSKKNSGFSSLKHKIVPIKFEPNKDGKNPEKFKDLEQPLYSDFFNISQQYLHPKNDVAAICNSDIHFFTKQFVEDADVEGWFFSHNNDKEKKETVMALTRYEEDVSSFNPEETKNNTTNTLKKEKNHQNNLHIEPRNVTVAPLIDDYRGSHDAFLFRPGVIDQEFIDDVRHPQNAYQSENIVIDSFLKLKDRKNKKEKIEVDLRNPCKTGGFRIAHKHESEVRQWYPPLNDGRYGKVVPE